MNSIQQNLDLILQQIQMAAQQAQRSLDHIHLLAVSKQQSVEKIRAAFTAGQWRFGENYVQEALEKIQQLQDLPIEWHFIGNIQANKTRVIAENFSWVHSIDNARIATRLNNQRPIELEPLQVCIEVNIATESQKGGVSKEMVLDLAKHIRDLSRLQLRGLMMIPPAELTEYQQQYFYFQQLAQLQTELQQQGFALDTLSMGMSHDFPAAIAAGATIVRIGTAIFGKRAVSS